VFQKFRLPITRYRVTDYTFYPRYLGEPRTKKNGITTRFKNLGLTQYLREGKILIFFAAKMFDLISA
jgi:hypothetical protein